jgi:phospholipid/cholesterol/gamma-HCH transport system ATP-binding protein
MGLTVYMVTHDLDSLFSACDRIAVLGNKKVLIEGTIEDMLASEEPWVKSYFRGKRARQLDLKARPKPGQPTSQQAENRV